MYSVNLTSSHKTDIYIEGDVQDPVGVMREFARLTAEKPLGGYPNNDQHLGLWDLSKYPTKVYVTPSATDPLTVATECYNTLEGLYQSLPRVKDTSAQAVIDAENYIRAELNYTMHYFTIRIGS